MTNIFAAKINAFVNSGFKIEVGKDVDREFQSQAAMPVGNKLTVV